MNLNQPWTGGGALNITGNTTTPANVSVNNGGDCFAVNCALSGTVTLTGVKMSGSRGINHNGSGVFQYGNVEFGTCTGPHVITQTKLSAITVTSGYTISGGAAAHWRCFFGIILCINVMTITLTGTPAFSAFSLRWTPVDSSTPGRRAV